jgi:elongator complex protein 5
MRSSPDLLHHLTRHSEKDATQSSGAILYDPDSADDIDDDDPDEDLDI